MRKVVLSMEANEKYKVIKKLVDTDGKTKDYFLLHVNHFYSPKKN